MKILRIKKFGYVAELCDHEYWELQVELEEPVIKQSLFRKRTENWKTLKSTPGRNMASRGGYSRLMEDRRQIVKLAQKLEATGDYILLD